MKLFFAKLIPLILIAGAAVVWEWQKTEERIAELGQVRGSVELLAKIIKLTKQVPNARVIMAGDSKAERQLDPRIFNESGIPAINIGIPSGDLYALLMNLELLGLDKSPATFIFSVGAYQINDGNNDKDTYSAELFFSFTPMERLRIFKGSYFTAARAMLKREELYRNYANIAQYYANSPGEYADFGFLAIDPGEFGCMRFRHSSHVSPWSGYRNIRTDGARWRLFSEAVKKLATWKGHYVIFNAPHSQKGLECMAGTYADDFEKTFSKQMTELIQPLPNVRFVDFFRQSPLPDVYFYDPGHLNKDGAAIFTRWWLKYLKTEKWL